ncbi:unnamed protein product [Boreogadus saida]
MGRLRPEGQVVLLKGSPGLQVSANRPKPPTSAGWFAAQAKSHCTAASIRFYTQQSSLLMKCTRPPLVVRRHGDGGVVKLDCGTSSRVGPILFGTRLRRLTFVLTHEVFEGPICGRLVGAMTSGRVSAIAGLLALQDVGEMYAGNQKNKVFSSSLRSNVQQELLGAVPLTPLPSSKNNLS